MQFFSTRRNGKQRALEQLVSGMFFPDIPFTYETEGERQETPVWLLPLDRENDQIVGSFSLEESLAEAPIGFLQTRGLGFKTHYHISAEGALTKGEQREDTLYLPLRETEYTVSIGREPSESSHKVLGLNRITEEGITPRPLVLVTEATQGIKLCGLYLDGKNEIRLYEHAQPPLADVAAFLSLARRDELRVAVEDEEDGNHESAAASTALIHIPSRQTRVVRQMKGGKGIDWAKPPTIVRYLDQFIIGQERAKRVVAVGFSNYMLRVQTEDPDLPKEAILCIGPTGVGKTSMLSLLGEVAGLPFFETKLVGRSQEGYVGDNASRIWRRVWAKTKSPAPVGIVYLDEIDKIARTERRGKGFGREIQDELIGWIEGADVVGSDDHRGTVESFYTGNLLFVTAGAFHGSDGDSLTDIIRKRLGGKGSIGFGRPPARELSEATVLRHVQPEDLIAYGLKFELIGRFAALATFDPLSLEDKVRILREAKRSPLERYGRLLRVRGYTLEVDSELPRWIAARCPPETGARALNAICADLFVNILYEPERYADKRKVIRVTPDVARSTTALYRE